MAELVIVAGEVGRGTGSYDTGLFALPEGGGRGVETVSSVVLHGGVEEKHSMMTQIVTSHRGSTALQGGVALAQTVDPTNSLAIAATVVSAGLIALDGGPRQRALVEVRFLDGASFVAMTDAGVAALIENDRRVVGLAAPRLQATPLVTAQDQVGDSVTSKMLTAASGVATTAGSVASGAASVATSAASTAGSAVTGAFSFIRKKTLG